MIIENKNWSKLFWRYWWYNLHVLAENYPNYPSDNDIQQLGNFFITMANNFPCGKCKNHFNQYINNVPYENAIKSKNQLRKYFIDLHNDVNLRTRKKIIPLDEAIKLYKHRNWKKKLKNETGINIINLFKKGRLINFVFRMNNTLYKSYRPKLSFDKPDLSLNRRDFVIDSNGKSNDWLCYINRYPDLKERYIQSLFPKNEKDAIRHWNEYGNKERREWGC